MIIHTVAAGETLGDIARQYGVDARRLALDNGIADERRLAVGQTIAVLFAKTVHAVAAGETLAGIAESYGVSVITLYRNNRWLMGQDKIYPGTVLVIDYFNNIYGRAEVNGYAYAYIERELFQSTAPYLTYVAPFTYGIDEGGGLLPLEDGEIRSIAADFGVGALLHLSTLTEGGGFSTERAAEVLSAKENRRRLIADVVRTVEKKGLYGVDVDFEYVPANLAQSYADFVDELRQRMNVLGKIVIVALAPKTSSNQRGLLYEGHDYALLGAAADRAFLMTYEWGYTYSEPMAVAPIENVRAVVEYALTQIPADKLLLGMPWYGYDWTLPYVKGVTRAKSLSPAAAVELAARYGAEIEFDETAMSPHFGYTDEYLNQHEVWFEDARSVEAKLKLLRQYALRGIGIWNLDRPFPQGWLVLNDMYTIVSP